MGGPPLTTGDGVEGQTSIYQEVADVSPDRQCRVTNRLRKSDRLSHLSAENLVALVNFDGVTFVRFLYLTSLFLLVIRDN